MTVREYIEYLKTLDQDKGIWVAYDSLCDMFEPIPDSEAEEVHVNIYGSDNEGHGIGVKLGDYVINAG